MRCRVLGDGSPVLIVDFSAVEAISSVGLRALVVAAKKSKAAGGKIVVSGLRPLVREVFDGNADSLVLNLVENASLSRAELRAIERRIADAETKGARVASPKGEKK